MSSNENEDKRLSKFDSHSRHLLDAIDLCLKNGYIVPAMMLTFAAIDGMANLYRDHEQDQSGADFTKWVDEFMIPHLKGKVDISSNDFWAARNALLHEQGTNSRLSRKGNAAPFLYIDAQGRTAFPLEASWKNTLYFCDQMGF